jgi:uncharacterized protein YbjT (DUF2867 family)
MKIVVIGGTGLIGSRVVTALTADGHEAVPASPRLGVNTLTGEGLADALDGAAVVVDVSNSPNFEYHTALDFFERSNGNLLPAARAAGVGHLVALSVVGTETLAGLGDLETTTAGYFQAKLTQEELIRASSIPYTIVHATQFFEFLKGIADEATHDGAIRLPAAHFQPMAADDVATAVARVAVGTPANGIVEVGGPEPFQLDDLVRRFVGATHDPRDVVTDPAAGYYGIPVGDRTLLPGDGATFGQIRFEDWLRTSARAATAV